MRVFELLLGIIVVPRCTAQESEGVPGEHPYFCAIIMNRSFARIWFSASRRLDKRGQLVDSQRLPVGRHLLRSVHEKHIDIVETQLAKGDVQRRSKVVIEVSLELGDDGDFGLWDAAVVIARPTTDSIP